jgi:hypothetical protein
MLLVMPEPQSIRRRESHAELRKKRKHGRRRNAVDAALVSITRGLKDYPWMLVDLVLGYPSWFPSGLVGSAFLPRMAGQCINRRDGMIATAWNKIVELVQGRSYDY